MSFIKSAEGKATLEGEMARGEGITLISKGGTLTVRITTKGNIRVRVIYKCYLADCATECFIFPLFFIFTLFSEMLIFLEW